MGKDLMQTTLQENDMVKVHMYDHTGREIHTNNYDKLFKVYEHDGKLGIDWTENQFTPFEHFAYSVIFENVETGKTFYFDNISNSVVEQHKES